MSGVNPNHFRRAKGLAEILNIDAAGDQRPPSDVEADLVTYDQEIEDGLTTLLRGITFTADTTADTLTITVPYPDGSTKSTVLPLT